MRKSFASGVAAPPLYATRSAWRTLVRSLSIRGLEICTDDKSGLTLRWIYLMTRGVHCKIDSCHQLSN